MMRRFFGSERGQALAEFALLAPLLLALLVGLVEMARAWNVYHVVSHAAREGNRNSVVADATDSATLAAIHQTLDNGGLDSTIAEIYLSTRLGSGTADTVEIVYPHRIRFLGRILTRIGSSTDSGVPGSLRLYSISVMRNE